MSRRSKSRICVFRPAIACPDGREAEFSNLLFGRVPSITEIYDADPTMLNSPRKGAPKKGRVGKNAAPGAVIQIYPTWRAIDAAW